MGRRSCRRWGGVIVAEQTWQALQADLSHHTLAEVLEALGRVSILLQQYRGDDARAQREIAAGLFGDAAGAVLSIIDRITAETGCRRVSLFEPLQVASLAKAALLFMQPDGGLRPLANYRHVGTALLRVSDLIGPKHLNAIESQEDRRAWAPFLFASGAFYRGGRLVHDLARFHHLCLEPHTELAAHPAYLDLPSLASEATGLPVHILWLAVTAHQSQWVSVDPGSVARGPVFIDERNFLSRGFHFTEAEQDRMVAIACSDAPHIQSIIRSHYSADAFKPYDLVPLADKPLIRLDHRIFCPSLPLLLSKLSIGLYYLIANSLKGQQRDRFTMFLGHVFERYTRALFSRMYTSPAVLVDESALADARSRWRRDTTHRHGGTENGAKTADFVLVLDRFALIVETKARFFSRAARSGEDADGLFARLDDVFSRAGNQLADTIELCESGALLDLGINPEQIRAYIPVIITLDETPLSPIVYDFITPVTPAVGAEKTEPVQVIGISELESLEVAVARGRVNLHAILGYKARSGRQADSLRNVVLSEPSLSGCSEDSPFLTRIYDDAMKDALQTLRVRMR